MATAGRSSWLLKIRFCSPEGQCRSSTVGECSWDRAKKFPPISKARAETRAFPSPWTFHRAISVPAGNAVATMDGPSGQMTAVVRGEAHLHEPERIFAAPWFADKGEGLGGSGGGVPDAKFIAVPDSQPAASGTESDEGGDPARGGEKFGSGVRAGQGTQLDVAFKINEGPARPGKISRRVGPVVDVSAFPKRKCHLT